MGLVVEICVQGIDSAQAAAGGGADRVELCENLAVGGVTPSAGVVGVVCEVLAIPVHVLIRCRGGDFVFGPLEVEAMRRDIQWCRERGAAGVVMGALTREGAIDRATMAAWIEQARPMSVTFHRAFDAVADPARSLDELIELGVDRVLTSAGAASAREGLVPLSALQRRAGPRLTVLAAGRVGPDDLAALARAGLHEVHAGSAVGPAGATRAELVQRLVARAHGLTRAPATGPSPGNRSG